MKPVMQTVIHPDKGNCMQAAVASLLEMKLDEVPNWIEMEEDEWVGEFLNFLWQNGYEFHGEGKPSQLNNPKYIAGVDGYVLVKGTSPRGFAKGHMVIYRDGKLAHDPHPSGEGVGKVDAFYMIEPRPKVP